jgi:hypothetical protein
MLKGTIENTEKYFNNEIPSSYTTFYKNKIKKIKSEPNIIKDLKLLDKKTKWMNKCSILLVDDKVIHGVKETSCNIMFCNKKDCYTHLVPLYERDGLTFRYYSLNGIFIHTDCWKFIKKNYNIDLKFSNLPKIVLDEYSKIKYNKIFNINYGDIEKYWEQDFDFVDVVLDKKQYLCSNPLISDKNIKQIKKNINTLKLKNDPTRIGPHVSASFYKSGDIKLGKNKKFWIIKNNKWNQINEDIIKISLDVNISKIDKKTLKILEKIPFIGQSNTEPIFLLSSSLTRKNNYKIELLLTESYKENIKQLI